MEADCGVDKMTLSGGACLHSSRATAEPGQPLWAVLSAPGCLPEPRTDGRAGAFVEGLFPGTPTNLVWEPSRPLEMGTVGKDCRPHPSRVPS